MANTLRELYPNIIRERDDILKEIRENPNLKETFDSWEEEQQVYFLDFCSGAKGVKMLRDGFFKEILDPDSKPERLEELLSLLLKQKIQIKKVLPNDSSRIANESSLLILDIVVELANGEIANIECQRIGYNFMGQRAACYSADLLLRQYKRIRSKKKKNFLYKHVQKVFSIIFYENSPEEFLDYPNDMVHYFRQTSNTGLELDLLQEYFFIPLDIVNEIHQNKLVTDDKLTAWFVFLSNDNPTVIADLIAKYPDFKDMYHEIYEVCKSMEKVMYMFSEELRILDRNTEEYMMEEMQKKIKSMRSKITEYDIEIEKKSAELKRKNSQLEQKDAQLEQKDAQLEQKDAQLEQKDTEIMMLKKQLAELRK